MLGLAVILGVRNSMLNVLSLLHVQVLIVVGLFYVLDPDSFSFKWNISSSLFFIVSFYECSLEIRLTIESKMNTGTTE